MDQLAAPPTDLGIAAARALDQLGLTADDVADKIRSLGIKGEQMNERTCPISIYLRGVDGLRAVEVGAIHAYVYEPGVANSIRVPMPRPVKEFVDQFDRGVHLDLVQADTAAVA